MRTKPQIIGVTGGIGCGKTSLTDYFAQLGYPVIDTDQLAKDLMQPKAAGLTAVIEKFGKEYLLEDGSLNRKKLAELIFNNPAKKLELEAVLHPQIRLTAKNLIEEYRPDNSLIFIAIPVIHQLNQPEYQLDYVLLVECDKSNQLARVYNRDGRSSEQIEAIIAQQSTPTQRKEVADYIIYNQGTLKELYQQADTWLEKLKNLP